MRWTSGLYQSRYEWHRWFAWRPIAVGQPFADGSQRYVWLEIVERIAEGHYDSDEWHYRFVQDDFHSPEGMLTRPDGD